MGKENIPALADKLEDSMISSIKQAYEMIKDGSDTLGELENKIVLLLNDLNDKNETLGKLAKEGMKILLRVEKDRLQIRHGNDSTTGVQSGPDGISGNYERKEEAG